MLPHENFDSFVRGEGALFKNFFDARVEEINSLSPSRLKEVCCYLEKQVFGLDLEDDRGEIERQAAFNRDKQRELAGENEDEKMDEEDEKDGGEGSQGK